MGLRKKIKSVKSVSKLWFALRAQQDKVALAYGFVNASRALNVFSANSAGSAEAKAKQSVLSANLTFPFLATMAANLHGPVKIYSLEEFIKTVGVNSEKLAAQLKERFDYHGSDKSTRHNYHLVYAAILSNIKKPEAMLEIGIGSINKNIVSNMGANGKPGASLRAFKDVLGEANIYGADYDKDILIEEERIKTFFVDQTKPETFAALEKGIPDQLSLIIDDGLHAPDANIATMSFALEMQKNVPDAWFLVEDIPESAISIWQTVAHLLPAQYRSYLVKTKFAHIFALQKIS